ncbi:MAG: hypothetical protein IKO98_09510 [Bacteroidales bacterium]|nr:hypothetical protein [Bacteroidales bacterium]
MKHLFICAAMVTMGLLVLLVLAACRTQKVLIHGPEGNIAYKVTLPEGFDTATGHKSSPTRWSFSGKCSGCEGVYDNFRHFRNYWQKLSKASFGKCQVSVCSSYLIFALQKYE